MFDGLADDPDGRVRLAYLDPTEPVGQGWTEPDRPGLRPGRGPFLDADLPAVLDSIAAHVVASADEGLDVFACPYPHPGRRVKGTATARRVVHADIDSGPTDLGAAAMLGAVVVASGSELVDGSGRPRTHVYVRLGASVDAATHERLCAALGRYVGGTAADPSKTSDHDVLRVPGTLNHKTTPARPVRWLVRPDDPGAGEQWDPAALARFLGVPDREAEPSPRQRVTGSPAGDGTGSAFRRVAAELRGRIVATRGPSLRAHCPSERHAHGNRSAALVVTDDGGRVLLYCHAGCPAAEVVAALGLSLADLYDDEGASVTSVTPTAGMQRSGTTNTTSQETSGELPGSRPASDPSPEPSDGGRELASDANDDAETDLDGTPLAAARARFRVLSRDDLDDLPEPVELVRGVLPAVGAVVVLTGERGKGKSLLSLDLAGHVSTDPDDADGNPSGVGAWWYAERFALTTHGPVLYVAREGFHGIPRRVRAWESHHGPRLTAVHWWPDPVDLKRPADGRDVGLIAADLGAVMVVTDTARATGAGKEDTEDMGNFVDGLLRIRDHSGALTLCVHNSGWDASRGRGSTVLPDAADTVLHLAGASSSGGGAGDVRTLTHHKHRDGDELTDDDGGALGFTFRKVEGTNSGVLVPASAGASGRPPMSREERRAAWHDARIAVAMFRCSEVLRPSLDDPARAMSGRAVLATVRARKGWELSTDDGRAALAGLVADGYATPSPHRLLRRFYVTETAAAMAAAGAPREGS